VGLERRVLWIIKTYMLRKEAKEDRSYGEVRVLIIIPTYLRAAH
jgi:hypothetical protein